MSDPTAASSGDSTVLVGPLFNFQLVAFFVAFTGIALFNSVEIIITTLLSFRRRLNWYFASLLGAAVGVIIYQTFVFLVIYGANISTYSIITALDIGWLMMVGFQSMILWSRLHLVCFNRRLLRGLLYMIIIVTGSCFVVELTLALHAVKNGFIDSNDPGFNICEKVVVFVCCTQEFLLSCVYIHSVFGMLRGREVLQRESSRRKMKELIAANVFIILLDVTLLALEFAALWGIWCSFKGVVYSIKIKVEFAILTHLKSSLQAQNGSNDASGNLKANGYGVNGYGNIRVARPKDAYKLQGRNSQHTLSTENLAMDSITSKHDSADGHHIMRTTDLSVSYGRAPPQSKTGNAYFSGKSPFNRHGEGSGPHSNTPTESL